MGNVVSNAILNYLNEGPFDAAINSTNIVLIPKVSSPSWLTDYKPISLCIVLYKLIAKVLVNHLKLVLPHVISPKQNTFIPGRLIIDNILVAFETVHTMDTRLKANEGFTALKLDMRKAYDRIEWSFLEAVPCKMGFAPRWTQLLMTCLRMVSYSILINGQPQGHIVPICGLKQGDPLSLYFFILCAEAMSSMLHQATREGGITDIPIIRGSTRVNHLFFADDRLLSCRAKLREWGRIQELLACYETASGHKINRDKTFIFFSRNTKMEVRTHILIEAGVNSTQQYEKYLGLPALIG